MTTTNKIIPIVILNWNGLDDTTECINSVLQLQNCEFRVILIDNGSSGEEHKVLSRLYSSEPKIEVRNNEENLGFVGAHNLILGELLENDPCEFIALLNNDTVVHPDWLSKMHITAKSNNADMVSSRLVNYYDRNVMDNSGHIMLNTAEILAVGHFDKVDKHSIRQRNLGPCAGAALYSKEMLKETGLFDPFFSTGYEDAELGARATLMGYQSVYEPDAIVFHKLSKSIKKIEDDQYFKKIQRNILYTYFKLMPRGLLIVNLPWIAVKYVLLSFLNVFTFRLHNLRLHLSALIEFLRFDLKKSLSSRKLIYNRIPPNLKPIRNIRPFIRFFFLTDIKRLYSLLNPNYLKYKS